MSEYLGQERAPGHVDDGMAPGDRPFAAAMLAALADAGIAARMEPPTTACVAMPNGETRPMDLGAAFEHARATPEDELPALAAGVARGVMRSFRRNGVPLGTHYPLPADDAAGHALAAAYAAAGVSVTFEWPDVILEPTPDGGHARCDVSQYRARAETAPEEERGQLADEFVRRGRTALDRSAGHHADPDGARERLRLRVYPDSALEAGVRDGLVTREFVPGVREAVAVDYPDAIHLLERGSLDGVDVSHEELFRVARDNSLAEPFEVGTHEARDGVQLLHLGGQHRYMTAHLHVLGRYLDPLTCAHGALVAFPVSEVVLAHVLGAAHPVLAMEVMQELCAEFVKGDNAVTAQVYWWRPRAHEHVGAEETPRVDHLPHLVPVGVDVDHEAKTISVAAGDDFHRLLGELLG